jgi:hypothetical protein
MNDPTFGLSIFSYLKNLHTDSGSPLARNLSERTRFEETLNTQDVFGFSSVLQLLQGQGFAGVCNT